MRPGHIFPLRYTAGGVPVPYSIYTIYTLICTYKFYIEMSHIYHTAQVLTRGGHTEASVDLARWAGLQVRQSAARSLNCLPACLPVCLSVSLSLSLSFSLSLSLSLSVCVCVCVCLSVSLSVCLSLSLSLSRRRLCLVCQWSSVEGCRCLPLGALFAGSLSLSCVCPPPSPLTTVTQGARARGGGVPC
eukprot:COSAG03_NODE_64_length_15177_cov_14.286112_1_plen_188_part_00